MTTPRSFRKTFFVGIYLVFALAIAYLLIFNTGFLINEQVNQTSGKKQAFIENTTARAINEITVKYIDNRSGKQLREEKIERLGPKEKKELDIQNAYTPEMKIIATSDFYKPAEKLILVTETKPSIITNFPKTVFFGERFDFEVDYCNNGIKDETVKIEEKHDRLFFYERNKTETLTFGPSECKKLIYSLLPAYRGETKIYFNVVTSNTNQQLEETLKVE